mgnify:CR=1 FL=1
MKCILKIRSLVVLVFLFISHSVNACQVPVFRYALERWASDKYELAIFFNDSLSEDQGALVNSLDINANIETFRVDAKNMSGSEVAKYGNILVPEGISLTLDPGVKVQINNDSYILVEGEFIAEGTETKYIEFI